jgi:hypothetical protein
MSSDEHCLKKSLLNVIEKIEIMPEKAKKSNTMQ